MRFSSRGRDTCTLQARRARPAPGNGRAGSGSEPDGRYCSTPMRISQLLLPTERQPPADAEALSHKLMVRAGLVRQLGSGLWTWLPAGWRVHQRIVQIVREEIDAIGGQEMLMPVLQ